MECAVYDTYVTKKDGKTMHFDVIVESSTPHEKAIGYGKEYLKDAGQEGQSITQENVNSVTSKSAKIVEDSIQNPGTLYKRWKDVLNKLGLDPSKFKHPLILFFLLLL